MQSDWTETTVGEFCPFIYGKGLPERNRKIGNFPVISSAGVIASHTEALVKSGGIVIGRKGTVGKLTLSETPFWAIDTAFYIQDEPSKRDLRFTYYLLKTLELDLMNTDSAVPGLNRDNAYSIPIRVPALNEQKKIANILGNLDKKIALLRETNATLEAMAQALFKSWFVDFDPVRAKAAGREPDGVPPEVAALFPSEFEHSELGEIPKGWGVVALDNIAQYLNGLASQKYPATNDNDWLPVIKIAQLRKGTAENADKASQAIPSQYVVNDGDVLFSWSGSLEVTIWCGGKGALNQHLFKVTSEQYPQWFYYLWTKYHLAWFRKIAAHKATTMGHIQRCHLTAAKVLIPDAPLLNLMSEVMEPLIERATTTLLQVKTLGACRDELLPRLISGQLRIPKIQNSLGELAP